MLEIGERRYHNAAADTHDVAEKPTTTVTERGVEAR